MKKVRAHRKAHVSVSNCLPSQIFVVTSKQLSSHNTLDIGDEVTVSQVSGQGCNRYFLKTNVLRPVTVRVRGKVLYRDRRQDDAPEIERN